MQLKNVGQNDGAGASVWQDIARNAVEGCDVWNRIARMNTRAVKGTTAFWDDGSGPVYRALQRTGQRVFRRDRRRLAHARADVGADERKHRP